MRAGIRELRVPIPLANQTEPFKAENCLVRELASKVVVAPELGFLALGVFSVLHSIR